MVISAFLLLIMVYPFLFRSLRDGIHHRFLIMLRAFRLNNEFCPCTIKLRNVIADEPLTVKPNRILPGEPMPQPVFLLRGIISEMCRHHFQLLISRQSRFFHLSHHKREIISEFTGYFVADGEAQDSQDYQHDYAHDGCADLCYEHCLGKI